MRRKRNHHFKSGEKTKSIAEISPAGIPIRHKRKEIANEIEGTNTSTMVGYVALFLSLFSIAFIQLRSAP